MTRDKPSDHKVSAHSGLHDLVGIAAYYRIAANTEALARELALGQHDSTASDIVRAALSIGLKARIIAANGAARLSSIPIPALAQHKDGHFLVLGGVTPNGLYRIVDPVTRVDKEITVEELLSTINPTVILVQRRFRGPGIHPAQFSFAWFIPSIWRYRNALWHVFLASFALQIFALVTPLFFQVVIDKVLVHRSESTLDVIVIGLIGLSVFDIVLQFLRSYALVLAP